MEAANIDIENETVVMPKKQRIYLLDIIRGILIIYVVFYHLLYDLNDIVGIEVPFLYSPWFEKLRDCMSGTLIFIAGISCNLSRSNIKRGLRTLLIAMAITLITYFIIPTQTIVFGILHFMGTMMLLYGLVSWIYKKLSSVVLQDANRKMKEKEDRFPIRTAFMAFLTFFLIICFFYTFDIYYGYVGLFGKIYIPKNLYGSFFMFIMGFGGPYMSADYYPILPWGFLFLAGTVFGRLFRSKNLPDFIYTNFSGPLSLIGSHTMLIYIAHQPLLLGVSYLLYYLIIR